MRTNVIMSWTTNANSVMNPSGDALLVPLIAPLVCGTLSGCFGAFVLHGVGLVGLQVSWLVQAAFYTASAFHFIVFHPFLRYRLWCGRAPCCVPCSLCGLLLLLLFLFWFLFLCRGVVWWYDVV